MNDYKLAYTIACPNCKAKANKLCRTPLGKKRMIPHPERLKK